MIDFRFMLEWPFPQKEKDSHDYFYRDWSLTTNKSFSIQISKWGTGCIFKFSFDWSLYRDHAGVNLMIDVWRYGIVLNFYDKRHWDYDEGRWYSYD